MLLIFAMTYLMILAGIDSTATYKVNETILIAFTGGVGFGFAYYFKSRTDAEKANTQKLE
jgi:uncharacterized membrane-anchored protein